MVEPRFIHEKISFETGTKSNEIINGNVFLCTKINIDK